MRSPCHTLSCRVRLLSLNFRVMSQQMEVSVTPKAQRWSLISVKDTPGAWTSPSVKMCTRRTSSPFPTTSATRHASPILYQMVTSTPHTAKNTKIQACTRGLVLMLMCFWMFFRHHPCHREASHYRRKDGHLLLVQEQRHDRSWFGQSDAVERAHTGFCQ